jgi:hypothetical protein
MVECFTKWRMSMDKSDPADWQTWLKENPPPDLQALVAKRGMYNYITAEDWAEFDAARADWEARRKDRLR